MTLRDLTEHLQGLCHEGYSNEEVIAEIDGLETPITSIRLNLRKVKDADGTHEENIIVLGAEKMKIETLDKTKLYTFTIKDDNFAEAIEINKILKDNGIKAIFLQENTKITSTEKLEEVIDYLRKEFVEMEKK